jgi:hypothetical protein
MAWGERAARGAYQWEAGAPLAWDDAVERFFALVAAFDATLAAVPPVTYTAELIFQGPIADALTHVGQLAMMRGTLEAPVRPESYARADISVGRVGREQSSQRAEFDGDASRPRPQ